MIRDLTTEEQAKISVYNFDHPNAFAWGEMTATLRELKAGRSISQCPVSSSTVLSLLQIISVCTS